MKCLQNGFHGNLYMCRAADNRSVQTHRSQRTHVHTKQTMNGMDGRMKRKITEKKERIYS